MSTLRTHFRHACFSVGSAPRDSSQAARFGVPWLWGCSAIILTVCCAFTRGNMFIAMNALGDGMIPSIGRPPHPCSPFSGECR
eukprot:8488888-Alexandrium_andersonii.AAC.1